MSQKRQPPPSWEQVRTLSYEFAPGHLIPRHEHSWHQLVYATQGVMTVRTPEGAWVVPAHRGVWVPGKVQHSIEISGRVSMRTLYMRPSISRQLPRRCMALDVPPLLRELILKANELHRLDKRNPRHMRLCKLIIDELQTLERPSLHVPELRDPRAARLAKRLEQHPDDPRSLRQLAKKAGASKRTLERIFKRETGLSFARWRQQVRFIRALKLLAGGEKVTAVALDVGYESPSAFVSAFRKLLGVTPGSYFKRI